MRIWPAAGPVGVLLVESRVFVHTPSLTKAQQNAPSASTVDYVHDNTVGLLVGTGVTLLGMACIVVFVAGFADHLWRTTSGRVPVIVMAIGVAVTAAAVLVGYGMQVVLAAAAEESSPSTVAAVYIVQDSLGYIGWTAMGLVSGGTAAAYLSSDLRPRWIGWFSLVLTIVLAAAAFAPFLSWFPALLWALVVGLGLTLSSRSLATSPEAA